MEAQVAERDSTNRSLTSWLINGDENDFGFLARHLQEIARSLDRGEIGHQQSALNDYAAMVHDAGKSSRIFQELLANVSSPLGRVASELEKIVESTRVALALIEGRGERLDRLTRENRVTIDAIQKEYGL